MSEFSIPYVHPLVVHFPIALLPASAIALVGWLVRDRLKWLVAAFWMAAAGLAGAVIAVLSGTMLENDIEGEPMVELFGHTHEEFGEWTAWMAAALFVAISGSIVWHRLSVRRPGVPVLWRLLIAVLGLAVAGLVLRTGHIGGTMVWGVPR